MRDDNISPRNAALQGLQNLEAAVDKRRHQQAGAVRGARVEQTISPNLPQPNGRKPAPPSRARGPRGRLSFNPWVVLSRRRPVVRGLAIGVVSGLFIIFAAVGALWWRLASGPIELDVATPWLTAAIERNIGNRYRVQVGGTQLERDARGNTALRLRDIVLHDSAGVVVATAPKAEVGLSGTSLLFANPRVESFRLVDANVILRIDPDGRVNVLAGGERPLVTVAPFRASPPVQGSQDRRSRSSVLPGQSVPVQATPATPAPTSPTQETPQGFSLQAMTERSLASNFAALLAWVDSLGGTGPDGDPAGFDGYDLTEIGLTNGSLTIDDRRDAHEWKIEQISVRLSRPRQGGAALTVQSDNDDRPWALRASLTPGRQGQRHLQFQARRVLLDDLLALRMAEGRLRSDTVVSASVESDIAADGTPQTITGTLVAQGGSIGESADPLHRIPINSAEIGLDWDVTRRTLRVPFKITAGAARISLRSEFAAPVRPDGNWMFAVGGGWIVLDPLTPDDEGLVLKRVVVRGNLDPINQLITVEHGDFGTRDLGSRDEKDVTIALSGKLDYGVDLRLALGLAGYRMSASALKRLWPFFITPKVRDWVLEHVVDGTVERIDIATNAPLDTFRPGGPPIPRNGLSIEIVGSSATLRPVAGLPPIRDADINVRVTGRTATATMGKGTVDVSPGRRLVLSNGVFEVPNTRGPAPPARVRFRVEGSAPAAAELLALDRLREFSGAPFDPANTRGMVNGQVNLALPLRPDLPKGATDYKIAVDLLNFSAEKMLLGHRIEAQTLRVSANNEFYEIKGDVKIGGAPAQIEYRKMTKASDAEIRIQGTLDEAARAALGLDPGKTITGALPMKLSGRIGNDGKADRHSIEADLTPVRIDNLLPGWVKPPGRPARVAFTLVKENGGIRFDDLLVDGQGVLARGVVELDGNSELESANFPIFAPADGDKASMKVDRGADGALRVVVRGDIFDGRNFLKTAMAAPNDAAIKTRYPDLDLDIKLGVVAGHHGEALRGLDLRMSRRAGFVRTFMLNAKVGRDTPLIGEMRARVSNGRPVLYFETNDAGALFRFTGIYPRMIGGRMWIGMDPPTQDSSPQEGLINVSNFAVRGEDALDRVVSEAPHAGPQSNTISFSQARATFIRTPGHMSIRDGVVRGPMIGATIEGNIDYVRDQVLMRGTLVPLYGINNMFGQIPIVGLFLGGGSNEGIFGITYEVSGPTTNPRSLINPISAIAPGVLRKFFEFRGTTERAFAEPTP
jgi:hypothetical protein